MATILIAEDDPNNAEILTELLTDEGYRILVAGNRADAVATAIAQTPHLILMDLQMPDSATSGNINSQAGLEATHHLKGHPQTQHIPIIALTAHNMMQERERILAAGCDAMQSKPYNFTALLDCIDSHLPSP